MFKQIVSQYELYKILFKLISNSSRRKVYFLISIAPLISICELSGLIIIYFLTKYFGSEINNGILENLNDFNIIIIVFTIIFLLFLSMKVRLFYLAKVAETVSSIMNPMINIIFAKSYLCDWAEKEISNAKNVNSLILSKSREIAIFSICSLFTITLSLVNFFLIVLAMLFYAPILSLLSSFITVLFYFFIANKSLKEYDELSKNSNIVLSRISNLLINAKENADVDYVNNASGHVNDDLKNSFAKYIYSVARGNYLQGFPRAVMETYGFAFLILIFAIPLIINSQSFIASLLKSSIIAVSFYKLLPALQAIYKNFGYMRFNSSELFEFLEIYRKSSYIIKKSHRRVCISNFPEENFEIYKNKSDSINKISFKNNKIKFKVKRKDNNEVNLPNFEIGKVIVFKGPSGSGKTTLMNCINLLNISGNQLNINGNKFNLMQKSDYSEIFNRTIRFSKFVYYSCRSDFYIIDQVSIVRYKKNLEILMADDFKLLRKLKNITYQDSRSLSLSTGQINRINLAYILSTKSAKFIFMDEPTANLDKKNSDLLAYLINSYKNEYCFTIASHDEAFDKIATSIITL